MSLTETMDIIYYFYFWGQLIHISYDNWKRPLTAKLEIKENGRRACHEWHMTGSLVRVKTVMWSCCMTHTFVNVHVDIFCLKFVTCLLIGIKFLHLHPTKTIYKLHNHTTVNKQFEPNIMSKNFWQSPDISTK